MITPAQALLNLEALFNRALPSGITGVEVRALLESIDVLKASLAKLTALESHVAANPVAPAAAALTPAQLAAKAAASKVPAAVAHPVLTRPVPAVAAVPVAAPVAAAAPVAPVEPSDTAISAPTVTE